jgi:hypothetical protein
MDAGAGWRVNPDSGLVRALPLLADYRVRLRELEDMRERVQHATLALVRAVEEQAVPEPVEQRIDGLVEALWPSA